PVGIGHRRPPEIQSPAVEYQVWVLRSRHFPGIDELALKSKPPGKIELVQGSFSRVIDPFALFVDNRRYFTRLPQRAQEGFLRQQLIRAASIVPAQAVKIIPVVLTINYLEVGR